ncbi:MAG TPA: DUF1841 family protein [Gaiellaceae bacterium]|nr:DUF1841 family protein [Gaiellaceae bacterium]
MPSEEEARRAFACPRRRGRYRGLVLDGLDPADPDERRFLIEAEHPELQDALERHEDVLVGGRAVNPRLHILVHEIVANQLWDGDPPEVWETAKRLLGLGYERHEVLHMLGSVVTRELWSALHDRRLADTARYVAALDELPGSYHALAHES